MRLKDLKIKTKLIISFGLMISLMVFISVYSNYKLYDIDLGTSKITKINRLKSELDQNYMDHLNWSNELSKHIIENGEVELKVEKDPHKCAFGKWYYGEKRSEAEKLMPEAKELFAELEKPHMLLHASADKIEKIYHGEIAESETQKPTEIYQNETSMYLQEMTSKFDKIKQIYMKHITETEDNVLSHSKQIGSQLIIFSLLIVLLSTIIAIVISRGLVSAIRQSIEFTKKISEGDLRFKSNIDRKDEFGQLSSSLDGMREKLREIVRGILVGSENITIASHELNSTSQQLSEAAGMQAASVEEVSASMEEIMATIGESDKNSQQTSELSYKAQEGITSVGKLATDAYEANQMIFTKIKMINDIAFQTNILALNAAVEAARAGDSGKGFSVVATEVRKLAENSKNAADEIVGLVTNGLNHTDKAKNEILDLTPHIEQANALVQLITSAGQEQYSGVRQVTNAIVELNNLTQKTMASSEKLASSSEELYAQSVNLKAAVDFFIID